MQSLRVDGIALRFDVNGRDTVYLGNLGGYSRYPEWDEMTVMGEIARINGEI